jgi:predicted type IV restriction endonuclease
MINSYDAKNVTVVVDGVYITGFAEGSFVECEKAEDTYQTSVGAQGDVGISEVNNPLGNITITLQQTSPSVSYLNRLAASKRIVSVWVISNNTPREKIGGTQARVLRPAQTTYSNSIESRAFQLQVFDYTQE